ADPVLLGALSGVVSSLGYTGLFLVVAGESAGIPLPGETGLIAGGILASQGHLSLALVVATAAAAASVGGVAGYLIGRHAGRRLISRAGPFAELRLRFVERGEEFFVRHGAASVFLARWAP